MKPDSSWWLPQIEMDVFLLVDEEPVKEEPKETVTPKRKKKNGERINYLPRAVFIFKKTV